MTDKIDISAEAVAEMDARLRGQDAIPNRNEVADFILSLSARLAEVEAERDRQYDENVHRIAEQTKAEAKLAAIPSPDALIRAALDAAAEFLQSHEGYDAFPEVHPLVAAIRALADDPEARARIIKAAEGRG
jgi:hypothetical protein